MTWLETLNKAVKELGMSRVAADLEYSRAAISLVLNGKYNACADRIAARVLAIYGELPCPFLRASIPAAQCRDFRERPVPTNSAAQIHHWRTCRTCKVGDDVFGCIAQATGVVQVPKMFSRSGIPPVSCADGRRGNAPNVATADGIRR